MGELHRALNCPICQRPLRVQVRKIVNVRRSGTVWFWRPMKVCRYCKVSVVIHRLPSDRK